MTFTLKPPSPADAPLAERLFGAILGRDALLNSVPEAPLAHIATTRLFGLASDPESDPAVRDALHHDPALRVEFRHILAGTAATRFRAAVAAATGTEILQREAEGCRIRLEQSVAVPTQYFVIIEFTETEASTPERLFIVDSEDRCAFFSLPQARDGIIQLLEESDSPIVTGLRDATTEVFLR